MTKPTPRSSPKLTVLPLEAYDLSVLEGAANMAVALLGVASAEVLLSRHMRLASLTAVLCSGLGGRLMVKHKPDEKGSEVHMPALADAPALLLPAAMIFP